MKKSVLRKQGKIYSITEEEKLRESAEATVEQVFEEVIEEIKDKPKGRKKKGV